MTITQVYVLSECVDGEGDAVQGVFASLEAAQTAAPFSANTPKSAIIHWTQTYPEQWYGEVDGDESVCYTVQAFDFNTVTL